MLDRTLLRLLRPLLGCRSPLLRLLRPFLGCGSSLLRRGLSRGLNLGWPLDVFASALLLRRARHGATALLLLRRLAGTLYILLHRSSLLRRSLLPALGRRGRSLHCVLPIVLLHHGLTRLVTVVLAVNLPLLLYPGIPVA